MNINMVEKVAIEVLEDNIEDMFNKFLGITIEENICKLTIENIILSFGKYIANCYAYKMKLTINTLVCFFIMDFSNKFGDIKNTDGLVEFSCNIKNQLNSKGIEVF